MKWWFPPSGWANSAAMFMSFPGVLVQRAIVVAALVLVGCGSSSTTGTGGGTGTGTGGGGGTGGGTGTGGGGVLTGPAGYINVQQLETGVVVARSATAAFFPNGGPIPLPGVALSCTQSQLGGCLVNDCTHDGGSLIFDGGSRTSAGTVTIEVGTDGGQVLVYSAAMGTYSGTGLGLGTWWNGGETISFTATGSTDGGTPAFTKTVTAPTRLAFSAPSPDAGMVTVTRNMPFNFAWTAGTGNVQIVVQSGTIVGGRSLNATCTVNASAGTFTLPASVTNLMLPTTTGYVSVVNETSATVNAGAYAIRTNASSSSRVWTATVP